MALAESTIVIGLTGPFGSGCSTISGYLVDSSLALLPGKTVVAEKLSDYVRTAWWSENSHEAQPLRSDLQNMGDRLRSVNEAGYLAKTASEHAEGGTGIIDVLVIDGIRNLGEIEWLRQKFGYRFYLFAINAKWEIRWERSRKRYEEDDRTIEDFTLDDSRDQDEEVVYGQQVQLCVDEADVILANNEQLRPASRSTRLCSEVGPLARLVAGLERRYPTTEENLMNLAYGASNTSFCLKRQVGAVIVSPENEEPISLGYNENPNGEKPCIHAYGECFRDMVRNDFFTEAHASKIRCPSCGVALGLLDDGPPWKCLACGADVEKVFFQDRAMSVCTAIHAEARAIDNARSQNLRGSTIFTTTFPCFLCAEKIINAGISKVVFAEPYPDVRSGLRLDNAGIEGVRARAFDRVFGRVRQETEAEIDLRRKTERSKSSSPSCVWMRKQHPLGSASLANLLWRIYRRAP